MKANIGALAGFLLIVSSAIAVGQDPKPLVPPSADNGKAVQPKEKSADLTKVLRRNSEGAVRKGAQAV